jgi:LPXTG-motif cell wall-anchored protein
VAAEIVAPASPAVAPAVSGSGELAFTGSSSLEELAIAGLVALLLGALLVLGARRRRVARG